MLYLLFACILLECNSHVGQVPGYKVCKGPAKNAAPALLYINNIYLRIKLYKLYKMIKWYYKMTVT